jgi:hypothetical protein
MRTSIALATYQGARYLSQQLESLARHRIRSLSPYPVNSK